MLRLALAVLVLVVTAFAPVGATKAFSDEIASASSSEAPCECCDDMQMDSALACAAYCHGALPSAIAALPQKAAARQRFQIYMTDGEGLSVPPPAPPPRS